MRTEGTKMTWALLTAAILTEVTATVALRFSEGFSRLGPSAIAVTGYVVAFILLSVVLQRGMTIGVAYGIWAASGVALVAIIGSVFLGEQLSSVQIGGLALIVVGVTAIEMGGAH